MNRSAASTSPGDDDGSVDREAPSSSARSDEAPGDTPHDARPVVAKLADASDSSPIRTGSPFAEDPLEKRTAPKEVLYDVGPIRYTAMGAVAASMLVLAFAAIAAWWFPAGGALIAALGCVLSIFGMYSAFRVTSAALLTLHLGIFVLSYARSLG